MSETQETTVEPVDDLDAFSVDFFGEKKAPDEPAKAEVEQDDPPETTEEVTEPQTTDEEETIDDEVPVEPETPKKKTFQDRINELVKQREDEKRLADARIDQIQKDFEAKLAALQPKTAETKTAEPQPTDLNADGTEKYPLGEFDPLYIKDLTRFTLESERTQAKLRDEQERQVRETEAAQATLVSSWNEKLEPAKVQYPDFQEKGQAMINSLGNLDPSYQQYLTNVLMSMDKGPDVLYYLASNPSEAVSIVNSGAQKATLALGRIEAKFLEADAQKQIAKPKISKAPPPPPQTRGSAAGHMGVEADTDDLDAFTKEFFKKAKVK